MALRANLQNPNLAPQPSLDPTGADRLLVPSRWSFTADYGPREAEIRVTGGDHDVAEAIRWLGSSALVYDDQLGPVWWGYVSRAEVQVGALTFAVDLEDMANSITVLYEEGLTSAASDTKSIALYGTHERRITLTGDFVTSTEASTAASTYLAALKEPAVTISSVRSLTTGARLLCRGFAYSLNWRYVDASTDDITTVDRTARVKTVIEAKSAHIVRVTVVTTAGVNVVAYNDGNRKALDYVGDILRAGNGTRRHLLAVNRNSLLSTTKTALLDLAPAVTDERPKYFLRPDGEIADASGIVQPPILLQAGFWLGFESLRRNSAIPRVFVESSTYDAKDGGWAFEAGGRQSMFNSMRIDEG